MLDLVPRFLLKTVKNESKNIAIVLTTIVVIVAALTYNNFFKHQGPAFFSSVAHLIGYIRDLVHGGYRCPLCGGTRSFLAMTSLDIIGALHFSILGTLIYLYLLFTLPCRMLLFFNQKNVFSSNLRTIVNKIDNWSEKRFLFIVFLLFIVQYLLDYSGLFYWNA